ncbi:MAG TPA: Tex family protein [Geopsychrobacteraceae bacterium]|nr:Tex family protein [Geopsychrobacteraceae bacterium]
MTDTVPTDIIPFLMEETTLQKYQVEQTVTLLQEGSTVPFIARYRKEATGELDEVEIRLIQDRLNYFIELTDRRKTIIKTIDELGKLTPELLQRIESVRQKTELEDLYLPYKPKRRTKAAIAIERGLEPLAERLLSADGPGPDIESLAAGFIDSENGLADSAAVLEGTGYILAERFADDAVARSVVRRLTWEQGLFKSLVVRGKEAQVSKYEMYYDYSEPLKGIPSHRMLAMRRGEKEEVLRLSIVAPEEQIQASLGPHFLSESLTYKQFLSDVLIDAYRRLLAPSIEVELRLHAKKLADEAAIHVFAENLRHLLLAAPAGGRRVLGIDPGLRTGSKLAVVDQTGQFLEHATIYPHTGSGKLEPAKHTFLRLIKTHQVEMIAVGNGTAGREMEQFARQVLKESGLKLQVVMISEAGASVYSASEIAREEFPELDLTIRGAISIARRLQDPLAELVKVDPKSIGVGQYQHDVNQPALKKSLDDVVESCVNFVGVDLNTASWALLSFVSGIGDSLARGIVQYRDQQGEYKARKELLNVPRFGQKAFEQAAGFLRIRQGGNPLDNTAVHPERYALVKRMAQDAGVVLDDFLADNGLIDSLNLDCYINEKTGLPTLQDIVLELKKPGRDPRDSFSTTTFREDVTEIKDLEKGMHLPGIVTNVAAFGAFVDIGVHQDGLVHISHLADRFVKDPNDVVKVGQSVRVRVIDVDLQRKRIALSMRSAQEPELTRKTEAKANKPEKTVTGRNNPDAWLKAGFKVKKGR